LTSTDEKQVRAQELNQAPPLASWETCSTLPKTQKPKQHHSQA